MELFSLEKRITHYSRSQKILLVGEGDLSFPVCLARTLGSATSLVATSLDSEVTLMMDYSKATSNLNELKARGCSTLLGVNVNTMSQHPFLINQRFDCIVYNFLTPVTSMVPLLLDAAVSKLCSSEVGLGVH
ncbi:hypothetical protein D8674_039835 [Pyrus ussuriensis x Pyrus communis]|uniref:25S rRNA (uridine-N(3))-methyltransferase BMT5-like domain-containing protein n=1 Tax=Pyrus ussuriensis x Pyrus communis TaxID=2448454 RepID=A0A5N5I6C9_9ROSA|nr:hypothetical protein D8674_039835 [Pyrus ussuriensis x Pyrus communis]